MLSFLNFAIWRRLNFLKEVTLIAKFYSNPTFNLSLKSHSGHSKGADAQECPGVEEQFVQLGEHDHFLINWNLPILNVSYLFEFATFSPSYFYTGDPYLHCLYVSPLSLTQVKEKQGGKNWGNAATMLRAEQVPCEQMSAWESQNDRASDRKIQRKPEWVTQTLINVRESKKWDCFVEKR